MLKLVYIKKNKYNVFNNICYLKEIKIIFTHNRDTHICCICIKQNILLFL